MMAPLLKSYRKDKELTLQQVSQRVGVPLQTLWRFEQGLPLSERNLCKILNWMLTGKEPLNTPQNQREQD